MAKLQISHHERIEGHPHRWHVHLHDRAEPIVCELPEEERGKLEFSDEEIHALLPTALERQYDENSDAVLPDEPDESVGLDAPVRLYQTHFMA
jgi:hypothetical protein